jgi:hypothetical protein
MFRVLAQQKLNCEAKIRGIAFLLFWGILNILHFAVIKSKYEGKREFSHFYVSSFSCFY